MNASRSGTTLSSLRRLTPAALALAAAGALSACYVLPMDPVTGKPIYPHPAPTGPHEARLPAAPVVVPPAPPAPAVYTARLYPLNDEANRSGLLMAQVSDSQTGRGAFSLHYRGQSMHGEATRVDANWPNFGRIHADALGGAANRSFTGRRGVANAYGAQGVNAQCEYVITGPSQGTGACVFSDGAKYQMHFGG